MLSLILAAYCMLSATNCNAQIITTVVGDSTAGYTGDGGQATTAELNWPTGIDIDASGNIFIADYMNNVIRKVSTLGIITTVAGTGAAGYNGDGGQATDAVLNTANNVTVDAAGNLYISDASNNCIRKVNSMGVISTIAGHGIQGYSGVKGYSGDGGQATDAALNYPNGIGFDASGNMYIADGSNHCIRMVNTTGIISTVAGIGTLGYSGDGSQATNAKLNNPTSVTFDAAGNLYIADGSNNRIRMVNTLGVISTVVGNGALGYNNGSFGGDGGQATAAKLDLPTRVTFDKYGNLYIADFNNNRIRKVTTFGIISTIAGSGAAGYVTGSYGGDGGPAMAATLNGTNGAAFDAFGNMYIADTHNARIRMVTNVALAGIEPLAVINKQITVYPNPAQNIVTIRISTAGKASIRLMNLLGEEITIPNPIQNERSITLDISNLASGIYMLEVSMDAGKTVKQLIKE